MIDTVAEVHDLVDNVPIGGVVCWKEARSHASWTFLYAAVRINPNRWYTTATEENPYVEHIYSTDSFKDCLTQRAQYGSIRSAVAWAFADPDLPSSAQP